MTSGLWCEGQPGASFPLRTHHFRQWLSNGRDKTEFLHSLYVTIGAGVRIAGGAILKDGSYLGAGALIREGCVVGPWSLVGMGAVVLTDIPEREVWVGVPARRLRAVTRDV